MRIVLLSGGSGKRLWPLSNDARSKQFLKVLEDENGQSQSMTQRVYEQLSRVGLSNSTVIATSKAQIDMLQNQLNLDSQKLVIEPSRRDTFPAILLAASYLYSVEKVDLEEVVAILPVDPFVQDAFFEKVKELETVLNERVADLALIGIQPTYPSTKYGYIVPKNAMEQEAHLDVDSFIEKPSEEHASILIEKGSLWNSGVFSFKLKFIINQLIEKGYPTDYEELLKQYEKLPKISFDYEVVEKTTNILAIPYDGFWKDLGTWNTLTEEMNTLQMGKGIISEDSFNTHLINELDIPITVLGVSNVVVAASPDGILVTDKQASPRIKEVMTDFDSRPMYEERRWGWYRVLDYTTAKNGQEVITKRIGVKAGKNLSYQYHLKRSEIWNIIKGEGVFVHNDQLQVVRPGDVLKINVGEKHGIKAVTDLEIIEVQTGTELIEEDIVRVFMTWDEVENHCYS